jgi:hypothetical protein
MSEAKRRNLLFCLRRQDGGFAAPPGVTIWNRARLSFGLATVVQLKKRTCTTAENSADFFAKRHQRTRFIFWHYNQHYDRGRCAFDITHAFTENTLYALPFHRNRAVDGWQVSQILTATTGLPIYIQTGVGNPGQAELGGIEGDRPNYSGAPGCNPYHLLNAARTPGSPFRSGSIRPVMPCSPSARWAMWDETPCPDRGLLNLDFAVLKDTKISERVSAQFRAEFFNIVNHTNFSNPPAGSFNTVFTGAVGGAFINPNPGRLSSTTTSSRQIHLL